MTYPITIQIDGMTCGHCTARVDEALNALAHVHDVEVVLEQHAAHLTAEQPLDDALRHELTEAVEDAGYDVLGISQSAEMSQESAGQGAEACPVPLPDDAPAPAPAPHTAAAPTYSDAPRVELDVRGMTCASCVARVERALQAAPGVATATVNYATERASVTLDDPASLEDATQREAAIARLESAVESAGYEVAAARVEGADSAHHRQSSARRASATDAPEPLSARLAQQADLWRRRWRFGALLLPAIMALQMAPMWFGEHLHGFPRQLTLVTLAYLTALVLVKTGRGFFKGAFDAARHGATNMDTLVALGSGVAFLYSLVVTVLVVLGKSPEGHVYFDGAAMILTLIAVGKWLEVRAKGRAGEALEALMKLGAPTARVQREGRWQELPVEEVVEGDRLSIRPGEKIPVDALILSGRADIDESMLTGESVPVARGEGEEVMAATINVDGHLEVRAVRVGGDTALARIMREVERAQTSKADVQRLADRISSIFVPVILAIALLTFLAWLFLAHASLGEAISPAIAVLVVACPCALGLATPTALMVGTSRGASQGILIREANALERASRLDALIFDKTGTLTKGEMRVSHIAPSGEAEPSRVLAIAAALEQGSEHPIAAAIVREFAGEPEKVNDFRSVAGDGVIAELSGERYLLGKPSWVFEQHAPDEATRQALEAERAQARTVIALASERRGVLGLIALEDEIKPDAKEVVAALTARQVEVWMVTGDDEATARQVAARVGIAPERVRAQVRPGEKAEIVRQIRQQEKGRIVGMVGDGINDAPALAEADLGIAMGSGAHVAMEAADITLVSEELTSVVRAVRLASATYGKIRQNLFWAFIYNAILVPVAALGWLVPALAAGAMASSSVSVLANSLLLKRKSLD